MKVGIIGSGEVGKTLAKSFTSEGNEVMLGTRNTSKKDIVDFNSETKIDIGTFDETAKFGELLVLCVKGGAAKEALQLAGKENTSGKIIIDTTNPIDDKQPPVNGVLHSFTDINYSLMEQSQKDYPDAKFVKCFNSVGNTLMYKPNLSATPTMFICGNDDAAKKTVTDILTSFGWETADMGKAEAARAIEPLCNLWCIPGFLQNKWSHAFKILWS